MNEAVIASIIVAIISIAGSAGFWNYRQSRRAEPVTQRSADLAVAHTSQEMALAVAAAAQAYSQEIDRVLGETRAELHALTGRFTALETYVREQEKTVRRQAHHLRILSEAWDNMISSWPTLRLGDMAPPKPHLPPDD